MKQIKILHLYYDLLNLYGENANVRALTKSLENQNIEVIIEFKSIDEKININNYDFIYLGSGSDENINIVESDFNKYINDFKDYISNGGFVLATGNALDLFSKVLDFSNKFKALLLFVLIKIFKFITYFFNKSIVRPK